jgi:RNA polymerase sigma-70 factor (ECF subfamily)
MRCWLLTIMQNLHIDRCRAAARRRFVPLSDDVVVFTPEDVPSEPGWKEAHADAIKHCLDRLDERLREAYVLHAEQRLPLAGVATRLGVSTSTVGTRVFRARRKLRQWLMEVDA